MSNYGTSTVRIIKSFFWLAGIFAAIYWLCGRFFSPGIIANLFTVDGVDIPRWLVPFRAIYFSIVTMTTLGFGDMYANSQSFWGHLLLTIQVLFGYVLLGALITRLAIVFTGEGPPLDSRFDMDKRIAELESKKKNVFSRLYNKTINLSKSIRKRRTK